MIATAASSNKGYVKCLIPSSDKTPHRAMIAEREYYKRTTEGFYRLEHFDLEDMFGRRPRPSLNMILELRPRADPDTNDELYFYFLNDGRGIAKHSGFLCRLEGSVKVSSGQGSVKDATALNQGLPTIMYSENIGVIHPNGIISAVGHAILQRPDRSAPLTVNLSWYCENMMMRTYTGQVAQGVQLKV